MRHRLPSVFTLAIVLGMVILGCSPELDPAPTRSGPLSPDPFLVASFGDEDRLPVATMDSLPGTSMEDVGDPPVAADVLDALMRLGRPIGEIEIVTDTEARFVDTRLAGSTARVLLRNGGIVEIFPLPVDQRPRSPVMDFANAMIPSLAVPQHTLDQGRIQLRLSPRFSDAALKRYEASLRRIQG